MSCSCINFNQPKSKQASTLLFNSKNMTDAYKATETVNEETGKTEIKVDTVGYVSPPGDNKETQKEDVKITHQFVEEDGGGPGVVAKGIAVVSRAAESAKEAIVGSGTKSDEPK
ncbi:unnamed protein product [Rhodiola kirilowii]